MATAPLIAIITPTRNRLALLRETMDSVAAQSLAAWEHIIVDDGSDDGTAEEVSRRAAEDPRIRYLPRTGAVAGANACRNQGAAATAAPLLVFLDSDDLLDPGALESRVETMGRNQDLDFAVSRTGVFLHTPGDLGREFDTERAGDDLLRFLYFETPWQTTAPTWRRESFDRLGGFDEALPSWQDVDLHVRALTGDLLYLRLTQVDHHMRWREEASRTSTQQWRSEQHLQSAVRTVGKFERLVREGPGLDWVRQRALCGLYFGIAERWAVAGRRAEALACWRQIQSRKLGQTGLYATGAGLLMLRSLGGEHWPLGDRILNKWKGWARMRTNPELVTP